jgi:hypothetical protein
MTRAEVAALAIRGIRLSGRAHIDICEVMRALTLTTDEAVEVRRLVSVDWRAAEYGTDEHEVLSLARTVTNQYARDYRLR